MLGANAHFIQQENIGVPSFLGNDSLGIMHVGICAEPRRHTTNGREKTLAAAKTGRLSDQTRARFMRRDQSWID